MGKVHLKDLNGRGSWDVPGSKLPLFPYDRG